MSITPPTPIRAPRPPGATDEELYLLGATRLEDYVDFVRQRTVGGRDLQKVDIADAWRDAARVYKELQTSEAGIADKPEILPLPAPLQAHVDKLIGLPHFEKTFSSVPVAFGMVQLDKLIVAQYGLTQSTLRKMAVTLPKAPDEKALAVVCLPLTAPSAEFKVALDDGKTFAFVSDTHDTRFLGAQLIDPARITDLAVTGHAQAVLALSVGFTTNVLNVIRYGNRLVLNNGYHRAYALHALGVTHAPCLIQVCGHWEDVGLCAGGKCTKTGRFTSAPPGRPCCATTSIRP